MPDMKKETAHDNRDNDFRPNYWANSDYAIPDESDLNPPTREEIRRAKREQERKS